MARKKTSEEQLIEKIDGVNKKIEEIEQEPIQNLKKKNSKQKAEKKIKVEEPILEENKIEKMIEEKESTKNFGIFETIVMIVIFSLIFCVFGFLVGNREYKEENKDYITVSKELQTFIEEYNYILQNYYGDIDKETLIKGAIKGMLGTLDDYSEFMGEESNSLSINLKGYYDGVGIEVSNDLEGHIVIRKVYDGTPASKANLKVGDFITKFNDTDLKEKTSTELVNMISSGKEFKLTIQREEETFDVNLSKERITLKSVYSEMLENNIGYISMNIFASNTYEQFKQALEDLEKQGMEKLILDVRGNGGGYLSSVEQMLSLFMDTTHVIYQTETKGEVQKVYSKGTVNKTYPIAILEDGSSASASEVLTSSLKENLNAYIIGKKSYGKGTVQELQSIPNLGDYKFTTKKWLTPNGNWINKTGIIPDLDVDLDKNYLLSPTKENDNQLQSAIHYFTK